PLELHLSHIHQISKATRTELEPLDPLFGFLHGAIPDSRDISRVDIENIHYSSSPPSYDTITIHTAATKGADTLSDNGGAFSIERSGPLFYSDCYKFRHFTTKHQITLFLIRKALRYLTSNDHLLLEGENICISIDQKSTINNLLFNELLNKNE